MLDLIRRWTARRWYRAMLPILFTGALAAPATVLTLAPWLHADGRPIVTLSIGLFVGLLFAIHAFAAALVVLVQMEAAVRGLLVLVFSTVTITATGTLSSIGGFASALVGAFLVKCIVNRGPAAGQVTAPRSRCLGPPSLGHDAILLGLVLALLPLIDPSDHRYLQIDRSLPLLACCCVLGIASGTCLVAYFQNRSRLWATLALILSTACFAFGATGLDAMGTMNRWLLFAAFALGSAATIEGCGRLLKACGFCLLPERQSRIVHDDVRLNLTSTDRVCRLVQGQGLGTTGGLLLLGLVLLIPLRLIATDRFFDPTYSFSVWSISDLISGSALAVYFGCTVALLSVTAHVAVHHFRTLVEQTGIVATVYFCVSILMAPYSRQHFEIDVGSSGMLATLALPMVLLTHALMSPIRSLTRFQVGAVDRTARPFSIRSIMLLTLMVGLELFVLRAIFEGQTLVFEEIALLVGFLLVLLLAHLVSLVWMRRYLGKQTNLNFLALWSLVTVPAGTLAIVLAAYRVPDWGLIGAGSVVGTAGFLFALFEFTLWLRERGWQPQT